MDPSKNSPSFLKLIEDDDPIFVCVYWLLRILITPSLISFSHLCLKWKTLRRR
ncbi:hypothetical protein Hanom_Chr12g01153871 [Helianthus anomalus]